MLQSTPSTNTASSKPISISTSTLSRRGHLLAEEIPGPESCVQTNGLLVKFVLNNFKYKLFVLTVKNVINEL